MSSSSPSAPLTLAAYARLPEEALARLELVRGRLVREPRPTAEHGWLVVRLAARLLAHVEARRAGYVVSETGFVLSERPATVRGPDIAFVARDRMPERPPRDFLYLAPDLAVEVVSRSNRHAAMQQKVLDYLDAGVRIVWLVDPASRTVTVYRSRSEIRVLGAGDTLTGEDVLPEFRLSIAELFAAD